MYYKNKMSNFLNKKKIAFSFSKSRISTNKNLKNDSIPGLTGLCNNNIYQLQNNINNNYDSHGIYTYWSNYNDNDNLFFKDIQIEENNINLFSGDRDISTNLNPLNFKVWLSPGNTRSRSFLPQIFKNIKYINFEYIIFPKYIQLNKFSTSSDISTNIFISDISNNLSDILINTNIISSIDSNINYQICNIHKTSLMIEINFTINYNKSIIYTFTYNYVTNTTILDKYIPFQTINSNAIQYISIQPTNNKYIYNTKSISIFKPIFPKLDNLSDLFFAIKKTFIVYKNSDLLNIYKFNIKLLDINYEPIIIQNLDINLDPYIKCSCSVETNSFNYSCKCYYLRHPLHNDFQLNLFLKLGSLSKELNKTTYFA